MSKHTPGPWRTDTNGHIVCYPEGLSVGVLSKQLPEAELKANHDLIVAAPDLLEALKDALASEPADDSCAPWASDARAVIAKAEGRS